MSTNTIPAFLSETQWETLLESINGDWCTPILGPEVNTGALLKREQLARELCRKPHDQFYPLGAEQDLVQVSQYLSVTVPHPDVWRKRIAREIQEAANTLSASAAETHRILAELKLSVYVTTNPDRVMTQALRIRKAKVQEELCPWNEPIQSKNSDRFPLRRPDFELSAAEPVVFYLFGNCETPDSMVLSYNDHLDFLTRAASRPAGPIFADSGDQSVLPIKLQNKLQKDYLLFLGYRVKDFDFHILMRSLRGVLSANPAKGNPLIAVQLEDPDNSQDARANQLIEWLREYMNVLEASPDVPFRQPRLMELDNYLKDLDKAADRRSRLLNSLRNYLMMLCSQHKLEVIFGTCSEFVKELGRRYEEDVRRRKNTAQVV